MQLHEKQIEAISLALNPDVKSLFISGAGGTGKSEVIKNIVEKVPHDDLILLAPTQSASQNIGGDTIHSFFKIKPTINIEAKKEENVLSFLIDDIRDDATDGKVVIVDEVSMMGESMMKGIFSRIKPKKLILVGDKEQLSPVKDIEVDWESFCERTVHLTHNYRVKNETLSKVVSTYRDTGKIILKRTPIEDINYDKDTMYIAYTNKKISEMQQHFLGYADAKLGDLLLTFGQCDDSLKRKVLTKRGVKEVPYYVNNDLVQVSSSNIFEVDGSENLFWCEVVRADGSPMVTNKYNKRPLVIVGDYDEYNRVLESRFKTVSTFQKKMFRKYNVDSAGAFKRLEALKPFGDLYFDDLKSYNMLWRSYFEIKNSAYARHHQFISIYKAQGKSFDKVVVAWDDVPSKEAKYVAVSRAMNELRIV